MDIYNCFVSLKDGVSDIAFADAVATYLGGLKDDDKIVSWRLMRRKLGLGPKELGEFHLMIEVEGLAQLDAAFQLVSTRAGEVEVRHHGVNSLVQSATFALYRDFPDPQRQTGSERF
jgi:hypothetical protein